MASASRCGSAHPAPTRCPSSPPSRRRRSPKECDAWLSPAKPVGLLFGSDLRQAIEAALELALVVRNVLQLAAEIVHVRLHVEMAVAAQIEQDGLGLALALATQRLVERALDHVVGFGRRQDTLDARELDPGLEHLELVVCLGLDQ